MMTETLTNKEQVEALIEKSTTGLKVQAGAYREKVFRMIPEQAHMEKITEILVKTALENIDEANPDWTYVASRVYLTELYRQAALNRQSDGNNQYGDFYELIKQLTTSGVDRKSTRLNSSHVAS